MNNLDPEVAENPDQLIVYGGTGRAARDWPSFYAIVRALRSLGEDDTLLVQSGKPAGIFRTHPEAPQPGVEPDAPLRPFCVAMAPDRQTFAVETNLHHRYRPKTLSRRDWGSRCRRSLRGFEFLELVSFRARVEQNEIGNGRIELAELLCEDRPESRTNEGRARRVSAGE